MHTQKKSPQDNNVASRENVSKIKSPRKDTEFEWFKQQLQKGLSLATAKEWMVRLANNIFIDPENADESATLLEKLFEIHPAVSLVFSKKRGKYYCDHDFLIRLASILPYKYKKAIFGSAEYKSFIDNPSNYGEANNFADFLNNVATSCKDLDVCLEIARVKYPKCNTVVMIQRLRSCKGFIELCELNCNRLFNNAQEYLLAIHSKNNVVIMYPLFEYLLKTRQYQVIYFLMQDAFFIALLVNEVSSNRKFIPTLIDCMKKNDPPNDIWLLLGDFFITQKHCFNEYEIVAIGYYQYIFDGLQIIACLNKDDRHYALVNAMDISKDLSGVVVALLDGTMEHDREFYTYIYLVLLLNRTFLNPHAHIKNKTLLSNEKIGSFLKDFLPKSLADNDQKYLTLQIFFDYFFVNDKLIIEQFPANEVVLSQDAVSELVSTAIEQKNFLFLKGVLAMPGFFVGYEIRTITLYALDKDTPQQALFRACLAHPHFSKYISYFELSKILARKWQQPSTLLCKLLPKNIEKLEDFAATHSNIIATVAVTGVVLRALYEKEFHEEHSEFRGKNFQSSHKTAKKIIDEMFAVIEYLKGANKLKIIINVPSKQEAIRNIRELILAKICPHDLSKDRMDVTQKFVSEHRSILIDNGTTEQQYFNEPDDLMHAAWRWLRDFEPEFSGDLLEDELLANFYFDTLATFTRYCISDTLRYILALIADPNYPEASEDLVSNLLLQSANNQREVSIVGEIEGNEVGVSVSCYAGMLGRFVHVFESHPEFRLTQHDEVKNQTRILLINLYKNALNILFTAATSEKDFSEINYNKLCKNLLHVLEATTALYVGRAFDMSSANSVELADGTLLTPAMLDMRNSLITEAYPRLETFQNAIVQIMISNKDKGMRFKGNAQFNSLSNEDLAFITMLYYTGRSLELFFFSISQTILELYQVAQQEEIIVTELATLRAAIQTVAVNYQESIVPMLTRLHNLSKNEDDMQTITSITSLGNEVITCSSQVYHFSDQLHPLECILSLVGLGLMLDGIGLTIALLSRPTDEHPLLQSLTVIALGCSLCGKAVSRHRTDPGADLVVASINKIIPLIPEIAKQNHADQAKLKVILLGKESAAESKEEKVETTPVKKVKHTKTTAHAVETEEIAVTKVEPESAHHKHKASSHAKHAEPEETGKKPAKLMQRLKKFVNSLNERKS